MAPVVPNPKSIRSFRSGRAFETWLSTNQASGRGTTFAEIREGHMKADTPEPAPGDVTPAKEEGWFATFTFLDVSGSLQAWPADF
jgi:hypothetical protein